LDNAFLQVLDLIFGKKRILDKYSENTELPFSRDCDPELDTVRSWLP
jgi:hypothetical protein